MEKQIDPKTVALQFNSYINNKDLSGLLKLMADDHTLIDSANNVLYGIDECKKSWTDFFALWPDYENVFQTVTSKGTMVTMQGYSICSDKRLNGRGIWTARIEDEKVSEWRIYLETEDNLRNLGLSV